MFCTNRLLRFLPLAAFFAKVAFLGSLGWCQSPLSTTVELPSGAKLQSYVVLNGDADGNPYAETYVAFHPPVGLEHRKMEFGVHRHEVDLEQLENPNRLTPMSISLYTRQMELSDEQVSKIKEVQMAFAAGIEAEIVSAFERSGDKPLAASVVKEIKGKVSELTTESESATFNVLLPHQIEDYKRAVLQNEFKRKGVKAFLSTVLSEALGLSEGQKTQIEEINAELKAEILEVRKETERRIRELEAQSKERALKVLTLEQRATLEELQGKFGDEAKDR